MLSTMRLANADAGSRPVGFWLFFTVRSRTFAACPGGGRMRASRMYTGEGMDSHRSFAGVCHLQKYRTRV